MFGKLILTAAATAVLGVVFGTVVDNKSAYAANTCGTPSSTAGCKSGDCYGGDRMANSGLWISDASCNAIIQKQTSDGIKRKPLDKGTKAVGETKPAR